MIVVDLICMALVLVFFAGMAGLVRWFDRLGGKA